MCILNVDVTVLAIILIYDWILKLSSGFHFVVKFLVF